MYTHTQFIYVRIYKSIEREMTGLVSQFEPKFYYTC